LQGRRTWLQLLCVTHACTRCSSASFSASCDAIRIGLLLPRAECFCSILADALVQFNPDLRLRLAVPHSPLLPPREPKPAHTRAISISSASSPQCRLISFAAFPLTASDVLHVRPNCSLGGSACSRRITTPLTSRATSLHIVALHAVQLLLRFQLPNLCSPGLAASLPRSHRRVRATWAYSCPGQVTRAHANRASSALRARSAQHLSTPPTSVRHRVHARATRSASLTFAPALLVNRLRVRSPCAASSARPQHQLSLLPAPLLSRRGASRAWPASPAPAQACTAPVSSACSVCAAPHPCSANTQVPLA
jgi:hypothetical protein